MTHSAEHVQNLLQNFLQEKASSATQSDKAQQVRWGQASGGAPPEAAPAEGARDGGLHAAMGAASAVSKQLKNFATAQSGPEQPAASRRLFGRSRRRSSKTPVSGGAPCHTLLLPSLHLPLH